MKIHVAAAALSVSLALPAQTPAPATIPASSGTALDGQTLTIPSGLTAPANILILGFTRSSSDATTAWEKPTRISLASPTIHYLDIAFIQDAPSFIRPLIVRSLKKVVPDPVKPQFIPLTAQESAWKQTVGFSPQDPDAAYVLLVDRSGHVRWQTHESFSTDRFNQLAAAARQLAASGK
ncbi:MAG: hypothetical protein HIU91_02620 [Acidobacteria bacterium]|nr:hypothetical protein [Acidobacteriota bacterium]